MCRKPKLRTHSGFLLLNLLLVHVDRLQVRLHQKHSFFEPAILQSYRQEHPHFLLSQEHCCLLCCDKFLHSEIQQLFDVIFKQLHNYIFQIFVLHKHRNHLKLYQVHNSKVLQLLSGVVLKLFDQVIRFCF